MRHACWAAATQIGKRLTDGKGVQVVFDFVGEQGAQQGSWAMTRRAGSHFVIGCGGAVAVSALDVIATERNVVGNLVGTYNELTELLVLAQCGAVRLHTRTYPLAAADEAMDDLAAGRLRGRGILIPSSG